MLITAVAGLRNILAILCNAVQRHAPYDENQSHQRSFAMRLDSSTFPVVKIFFDAPSEERRKTPS